MQIGIDSFVINTPVSAAGGGISTAERMNNLLAKIECADRATGRDSTSSASASITGPISRTRRRP